MLILTSATHLLSVPYGFHIDKVYGGIILTSTILSILYHRYNEQNRIINLLDYTFAAIWFAYDMWLSTIGNRNKILLLNVTSLVFNMVIDYQYQGRPKTIKYLDKDLCKKIKTLADVKGDLDYCVFHSLWHLFNVWKSIYVILLMRSI